MKKTVTVDFFLAIFFVLTNTPAVILGADNQHESTISDTTDHDKLAEFEIWAIEHGIELVGTNKGTNYLYYNGFNPQTDSVDWKTVSGVLITADALYMIPEDVIQVMMGKTIYFSNQPGRSYTVLAPFPDYNILEGMNRGIILEQEINAYTVVHELGHIVDYHGIQGMYGDKQNIFGEANKERIQVFAVNTTYNYATGATPPGHITAYSAANDAENFAENFAFYVMYPDEYKFRAKSDSLLVEEYNFLKQFIFEG